MTPSKVKGGTRGITSGVANGVVRGVVNGGSSSKEGSFKVATPLHHETMKDLRRALRGSVEKVGSLEAENRRLRLDVERGLTLLSREKEEKDLTVVEASELHLAELVTRDEELDEAEELVRRLTAQLLDYEGIVAEMRNVQLRTNARQEAEAQRRGEWERGEVGQIDWTVCDVDEERRERGETGERGERGVDGHGGQREGRQGRQGGSGHTVCVEVCVEEREEHVVRSNGEQARQQACDDDYREEDTRVEEVDDGDTGGGEGEEGEDLPPAIVKEGTRDGTREGTGDGSYGATLTRRGSRGQPLTE